MLPHRSLRDRQKTRPFRSRSRRYFLPACVAGVAALCSSSWRFVNELLSKSFRLIRSRQTGFLFGLVCSSGVKRRSQPTRPLVFTRGSVFPVVLVNSSLGSISGQRVCPLFWDVHR